jgi:hypothetical protein
VGSRFGSSRESNPPEADGWVKYPKQERGGRAKKKEAPPSPAGPWENSR